MTKREAVNWLINISADIGKAEHRDLWHYEQALDEIREMLEDVPDTNVGDMINRQDLCDYALNQKDKSVTPNDIMRFPSAQPEQRWIPVTERLPEDGKWCLFTDGVNSSVERYKADAMDHFFPEGRWFGLEDTVAWMPLPAPYTERREE